MAPNGHLNGGAPPGKYPKSSAAEAHGFEGVKRSKNKTPFAIYEDEPQPTVNGGLAVTPSGTQVPDPPVNEGVKRDKGKGRLVDSDYTVEPPKWNGPPAVTGNAAMSADPFIEKGANGAAAAPGQHSMPRSRALSESQVALASSSQPTIVRTPVHNGIIGSPMGSDDLRDEFSTDKGSDLPGSRFIQVDGLLPSGLEIIDQIFEKNQLVDKVLHECRVAWKDRQTLSIFYVTDSLHNAGLIAGLLSSSDAGKFQTSFVSAEHFLQVNSEVLLDYSYTIEFTGQILLTAECRMELDKYDPVDVAFKCKNIAASYGRLVAWKAERTDFPTIVFRVEFDSVKAADSIVYQLHDPSSRASEAGLPNISISAAPYKPSLYLNGNVGREEHRHQSPRELRLATPPTADAANGQLALQGKPFFSPTGRTSTRMDANGNELAGPGYNKLPSYQQPDRFAGQALVPGPSYTSPTSMGASHGFRYPREHSAPEGGPQSHDEFVTYDMHSNYASINTRTGQRIPVKGSAQDVFVDRIVNGLDVRTTLMIRNVPRNWSAAQLENCLNRCCRFEYDFSYLRFDFSTGQNVSYAFVNFTSTNAVLKFIRAWVDIHLATGRRKQPGEKNACEVSYANTQGFECLQTKFRNSAILTEAAGYQPKLWYTADNTANPALFGKPMPWPPHDNPAKLQRSIQNASTNGLYRNNRGRRPPVSHHDRGTMAQMRDEHQHTYSMQQHGFGAGPAFMPQQLGRPPMTPAYGGFENYTAMAPMAPMQPFQPQPYFPPPQMLPPPPVNNAGNMLRTDTNGRLARPHLPVWPAALVPAFGNNNGEEVVPVPADPARFTPSYQQYSDDQNVPRVFHQHANPEMREG